MKRVFFAALAALALGNCSSYMAATGEEKRDLGILAPGTTRDAILAEFGTPVSSINEPVTTQTQQPASDDSAAQPAAAPDAVPYHRYDIFRFVQGRSTGSNVGRAVFYGAAAVFTLGLSEVIATPLEGAVGDQGEIKLRANYDDDWRLISAELLDGKDWISIREYSARQAQRQAEIEASSQSGVN